MPLQSQSSELSERGSRMATEEGTAVEHADSTKAGTVLPEVIAVHLYHHPDNPREVNGVTYVVRLGARQFTISARAGVLESGVEAAPAVPIDTGSEEYLRWAEDRHELIAAAQVKVGAAAPILSELLSFGDPAVNPVQTDVQP